MIDDIKQCSMGLLSNSNGEPAKIFTNFKDHKACERNPPICKFTGSDLSYR